MAFSDQAAAAGDEAANLAVVEKLMQAFRDAAPRPENVAALLADDAYVKWSQTDPAVIGRAAILDKLRLSMKPGARFTITVYDVYAAGSVVINKRADGYAFGGKVMTPVDLMGVFVFEHGKIKTWIDYAIPKDN